MKKPLARTLSTSLAIGIGALLLSTASMAKLPTPVLSDEAKAKAAEAAARTAHSGKVGDYQLCQSMDRVAARYIAAKKKAGDDVKPPTPTPPCADPGPFVFPVPAAAAAAPAAAVAAAVPAANAAAKKPDAAAAPVKK